MMLSSLSESASGSDKSIETNPKGRAFWLFYCVVDYLWRMTQLHRFWLVKVANKQRQNNGERTITLVCDEKKGCG
ncbi:hypothetical protein TUM4261_06720 [Shewanella sp. c952]|nr:hypothetical protein TUM4261_06720 [Shewanella sp. c952]